MAACNKLETASHSFRDRAAGWCARVSGGSRPTASKASPTNRSGCRARKA